MKNHFFLMPLMAMVVMMSVVCSCGSFCKKYAPEVGTLTVYYAKENFKVDDMEYKKGQLICDSNDPMNKIIDQDDDNYKYEGDGTGEEYSCILPKIVRWIVISASVVCIIIRTKQERAARLFRFSFPITATTTAPSASISRNMRI